jgi:hypothetical protein
MVLQDERDISAITTLRRLTDSYDIHVVARHIKEMEEGEEDNVVENVTENTEWYSHLICCCTFKNSLPCPFTFEQHS